MTQDSEITTFSHTITGVEKLLDRQDAFIHAMPMPCILYSTKDIILWYNDPMARLFLGKNPCVPNLIKTPQVLHKTVTEAFIEEYASFVTKHNAEVRDLGRGRYDEFTIRGSCGWFCYRFPVLKSRVGAVLLPRCEHPEFFSKER